MATLDPVAAVTLTVLNSVEGIYVDAQTPNRFDDLFLSEHDGTLTTDRINTFQATVLSAGEPTYYGTDSEWLQFLQTQSVVEYDSTHSNTLPIGSHSGYVGDYIDQPTSERMTDRLLTVYDGTLSVHRRSATTLDQLAVITIGVVEEAGASADSQVQFWG